MVATRRLFLALPLLALPACSGGREPTRVARVQREAWGTLPDGRAVEQFTFHNDHGVSVSATTYGAIITSIKTPDRAGHSDEITLGYDSLAGYLASTPYFGAVVGRVANRIAGARFTLGGHTYTLAANNGPNALHGGLKGFDKVLWSGNPFQHGDSSGVVLHYTSPDGEEGYPGTVAVQVTYTLTADNNLVVDFQASTDKATPVNLSQHAYWNLHGGGRGTITDHLLSLDASHFTPVDSTLIPSGVIADVAGTPFDFRRPTVIGARIGEDNVQLRNGRGYDHNWVLDRNGSGLMHAARLVDSTSGRTLDVATTEPGLQFYSGNFLDGTLHGHGGQVYPLRSGLALETQHFPGSPHHPNFPSIILQPGDTLRSRTVFSFGTLR